jgi:hypothetical protein
MERWNINTKCAWCNKKIDFNDTLYFICDAALCSYNCVNLRARNIIKKYDTKLSRPENWPRKNSKFL